MRATAIGVMVAAALVGCSGEPADSVVVPGAPPGGDPRPSISTVAPAPTSTPPTTVERTSTTAAPTSLAPATTVAPTTVVAVTTVPAAATTTVVPTTVAPTTTELVYAPEPAEGALRVGVEGPRSLKVQQDLITLGILPSTAADSKYGPGTAAGVRRFQESQGLVVDGVAGPNTLAALAAAVAAAAAPPPTTAA